MKILTEMLNMKKALLLLVAAFFIIVGVCHASNNQSIGYRKNFPIKVHVPETHPKTRLIKSAFGEWYKKTNGLVDVEFLSDERAKAATMDFEFVDYLEGNRLGETQNYIVNSNSSSPLIVRSVIRISTKDKNSKLALSDQSLYYIILHEIAHAFGLNHSNNPASVMYPSYNPYIKQSLLPEDITAFKNLYK